MSVVTPAQEVLREWVLGDGLLHMRVVVDEARGDDLTTRVDHGFGERRVDAFPRDEGDPTVCNGDVHSGAGCAGAVDDGAAPDKNVIL